MTSDLPSVACSCVLSEEVDGRGGMTGSAGGVKERGVRFPGDRESIRWQASQAALDMVRVHFLYNGKQPTKRA